ncbi:hypothetical protein E2562_030008 [Oryza meyeriana var. granulata]|uniref:DUF659 domain-containing protein n=1 Tax=Oryza meyeriana var. granulata TaxID=110450 RepID=A0A6G1FE54_9ORYZ|nr:hypothetical protein E2562_030008 [Oryza meyeriana var. granulata]
MSSAASNPSFASVNEHPLKRNSDDVGWEYGILVDPNDLNVIKCKLCPHVVRAEIYRLKLHIAGKKGQVRSCPNATKEDKEKCLKAIEDSRKVKRARLEKQKEVVDDVCIDVLSDHEDNLELDEIGSSIPRAVGLPFNSINCEEFDQMLEVAGRFGPGAKKPYQHELREKLLHEQVEDTKKMLKAKEQIKVAVGTVDKTGNLCNNIIEIIEGKMENRYNDPSIFEAEEVMDGFIAAVETFYHAKWWANYGTQVPIHTKKRNRLTCERVEQLVFVRFNNIHAKQKIKAKENKRVDPLLSTDATFAQGWMVHGADDESSDVEPVTGLTWKIIAETCGDDEVTQLRRSARLAQSREIEEDVYSESEEEAIDDEDIEFESDQDEVVTTGYDQEGEEDIDV